MVISDGDVQSMRALFEVVTKGDDIRLLEQLLESAERDALDLQATNTDGWSLLHHAAKRGWDAALELLLDNGLTIDMVDESRGWTALHVAAVCGNSGTVQLLLEHEAHSSLRDKLDNEGKTALCLALETHAADSSDIATMQALIDGGADLDIRYNGGLTAMHLAAGIDDAATGSRLKSLLERCENIDEQDHHGWTALHHAAFLGPDLAVDILLDSGASPCVQNTEGKTALHYACMTSGTEVKVRALLRKGALPNTRDLDGWTALHHAANQNRSDIVRILLATKADCSIENNEGQLPCELAQGEIVPNLFSAHGRRPSESCLLASVGRDDAFGNRHRRAWKAIGLNTPDEEGRTLLHLAVLAGNPYTLKLMLDDFRMENNSLESFDLGLFRLACATQNASIMLLLLDHHFPD